MNKVAKGLVANKTRLCLRVQNQSTTVAPEYITRAKSTCADMLSRSGAKLSTMALLTDIDFLPPSN